MDVSEIQKAFIHNYTNNVYRILEQLTIVLLSAMEVSNPGVTEIPNSLTRGNAPGVWAKTCN